MVALKQPFCDTNCCPYSSLSPANSVSAAIGLLCCKIYTIGPLYSNVLTLLWTSNISSARSALNASKIFQWKLLIWLNLTFKKSRICVTFASMTTMTTIWNACQGWLNISVYLHKRSRYHTLQAVWPYLATFWPLRQNLNKPLVIFQ